jgi:hypothetical protein
MFYRTLPTAALLTAPDGPRRLVAFPDARDPRLENRPYGVPQHTVTALGLFFAATTTATALTDKIGVVA